MATVRTALRAKEDDRIGKLGEWLVRLGEDVCTLPPLHPVRRVHRHDLTTPIVAPALAASSHSDARDFFAKFVAAQNAHDIPAVEALLWDSPRMLWFTRGVEVRGAKAIAETLMDYYAGTWHLEPDMSRFQSTAIADDVVQILVPITFTRGLPGKPAQDNTFLISQTLVRGAAGWRVAAILPIANTKIK